MSPARMCSLATSTAAQYDSRPIVDWTSGMASPASGGSTRLVLGAGPVCRQRRQPVGSVVVRLVELGVARLGRHDHVLDERDPLAPVVEHRQLTDDRQDGVGVAQVVGRDLREVLDLPDHVVAEVADDAAVQRRELGQMG